MVDIDKIKDDVRNLVYEARISANKIVGNAIPSCDAFSLSFLIGDVDEARGSAAVLAKLYPEDKEIDQMWKEVANLHIFAYRGRDKFIEECECKKK